MPKGRNIFKNIQNVKKKNFFFHKLKIDYLFFIVNNIIIKMDKWHSVAEITSMKYQITIKTTIMKTIY